MAKSRKKSLAARIQDKRNASSPPRMSEAPEVETEVEVAPLPPLPVFTEPRITESEAPAATPEVTSIAPVATSHVAAAPANNDDIPAGIPVRSNRWMVVVAGLAAAAALGIGFRMNSARNAAIAAAKAVPAAPAPPPKVEAPTPPPLPTEALSASAAPAAQAPSAAASADAVPSAVPTAVASASAAATAEPAATPAPSASAVASAAPSAAPAAAPSATAAASAPPSAPPDEKVASARALRDESLELLKKSKNHEAMVTATAAMEADPTDAMPYLVLGSALQDAGKWKEANAAYALCVKNATRGMVDECRAMRRAR